MAQVKGSLINAWISFLKARYGDDKVASAIESLDASDRSDLQLSILDSSWYPIEMQKVMGRLTKVLASSSDRRLAEDLGRYTADYVYTKIYRNVLSWAPNKNQSTDWFNDLLYQGFRKCVSTQTGPSSSVTRYHYLEGKPTSGQCRTLGAFLLRMAGLRGKKNVSIAHQKCLAKGADCCEFVIEWEN
jgi:hypothetical protein